MSNDFWLQLGLGGAAIGVMYRVVMTALSPLQSIATRLARIEKAVGIPDDAGSPEPARSRAAASASAR